MKPRTFLRADIADHSNALQQHDRHMTDLSLLSYAAPVAKPLVFHRQAIDVIALEEFAGGFGLLALEPGKTGAIEGGFAALHRLGEGARRRQQARRLALHQRQPLMGFRFGRIGADLDHPAGTGLRTRRRRSRRRRGFTLQRGLALRRCFTLRRRFAHRFGADGSRRWFADGGGARRQHAEEAGTGRGGRRALGARSGSGSFRLVLRSRLAPPWGPSAAGFTETVRTATGRIGSAEPADGAGCGAAGAGAANRAGMLLALAIS